MMCFVYDLEEGFQTFETPEEQLKYANKRINSYLDDNEWGEGVADVVMGVITHTAQQKNVIRPEGQVDEEGFDESGDYWEIDIRYRCNYDMMPVIKES